MDKSRRTFLKLLATIAASGISGNFAASGAEIAPAPATGNPNYKVLPWAGDNFTLGHRLRDGSLPTFPDKAERTIDFVIVGGGMAGLATAFYLKDHDFLLLEQYAKTGGTSSGDTYKGVSYSQGAVCTGNENGLKRDLFEALKIKPAIISAEATDWHVGGQWLKTINGNDKFHTELKRLIAEIDAILASHNENTSDVTFSKYLSGYDPQFLGLINNICKSFFCAGSDYVSARSGFFMIKALTTDSYVFDGGNSGISRALRAELDKQKTNSILTDSFVWSVKPLSKGGASVCYTDAAGLSHRIDCKHVVVCVPSMVATRIIPDLPESIHTAWRQLEYGAFVVANFCMPKKVLQYPYQSFADEPYPFSQMVMAEAPYEATGRYTSDMGSVLTVYHPYEHGAIGRSQVIQLNKEEIAASMIKQLTGLLEPFENNLESVQITRWGHAGLVPKPGLSSTLNKTNQYTTDWMTFAHSTASGGQSLEGALGAARNAADRCLKIAGAH